MAKVLCTLPNASSNINGVRFVTHRYGMLSEEIDDAVALAFSEINGYVIYDPEAATKPIAPPTGGTPPATPPAGSQAQGGEAGKGGAPDPNF